MQEKPYTVLIVGAFPPPERRIFGGTATSCTALINSSFKNRFRLVLIDTAQVSNPAPGFVKRLVLASRRLILFFRSLLKSNPHAVILFSTLGASHLEKLFLAWIARMYGSKVLAFPRAAALIEMSQRSGMYRSFVRLGFSGATHFLCQGPAWQRFATEVVGFPLSRAPIVPNWTATNSLLAIGEQRAVRAPGRVLQLLFLGWLVKEKGILELLQSCRELVNTHEFRLVIAGRGHAEEAARKFVDWSGLSCSVHFAGWVHDETLERLLAESDILVLPSWAEGLPNAMIEAMAAGLAVVVSAVGNVPDVVTDGVEALLVPPKQPALLKQAIQKLLDDETLRQQLAARGHAFVRERYAVELAVQRLSEVIESAIEE